MSVTTTRTAAEALSDGAAGSGDALGWCASWESGEGAVVGDGPIIPVPMRSRIMPIIWPMSATHSSSMGPIAPAEEAGGIIPGPMLAPGVIMPGIALDAGSIIPAPMCSRIMVIISCIAPMHEGSPAPA